MSEFIQHLMISYFWIKLCIFIWIFGNFLMGAIHGNLFMGVTTGSH